MLRHRILPAAVALVGLGLIAPATASGRPAPPPVPDETQTAWVASQVRELFVDVPGGPDDGPRPEVRDATVYLVAPMDAAAPQDPGIVLPLPGGTIIVPVHDTVLDRPRPRPHDCFGVQVVAGPLATPETVLTRVDPNGGATLAYAVRIGGGTVRLDGRAQILLAERLGLVTLDTSFPGYGGRCWTGGRLP